MINRWARLRIARLGVTLAWIAVTLPASAEPTQTWTSAGPFCGRPNAFAGSAATGPQFLTVAGRLYRSVDERRHWHRLARHIPSLYSADVVTDPRNPRTVYYGPPGESTYRSDDAGETWTVISNDIPGANSIHVVVPDSSDGTIFGLVGTGILFRSPDRGSTWVDISPPTGPGNYSELQSHPLDPNRLWLHTYTNGVWRSDDGGDSWTRAHDGLPEPTSGGELTSLLLDPTDVDAAWIVWYEILYRTIDASHWSRIGPVPSHHFLHAGDLLAGPGDSPVLMLADNGDHLPEQTPGVWKSLDGGTTWQPAGLEGEHVYELVAGPSDVVALTGSGSFSSSNLGGSWERFGDGVAFAEVRAMELAGDWLLAGANRCPQGRLARSRNGGRSWILVPQRFDLEVASLAAAPSDPRVVYLGSGDSIYSSVDSGATWSAVFPQDYLGGSINALSVHPQNPEVVYGASISHGLLRSLDGGETWETHLLDYPFHHPLSVAIDPIQPNRIFTGSDSFGLARSMDGGESWQPLPGFGHRVFDLEFDPTSPGTLWAATYQDGDLLVRSTDGGQTWVPRSAGLEGEVYRIAIHPTIPGLMFVTTESGIYRSTNGGGSWSRFDDGLPEFFTFTVGFGPGGIPYAGTLVEGVFSLGLPTYDDVCVPDAETACLLDGKFEVRGTMHDFADPPLQVPARVMDLPDGRAETDQAAFFESFRDGNFEIGVKMVDGCGLPADHPLRAFWLFVGGLTNAATELTVEDTVGGEVYEWNNPAGRLPTTLADTGAFACSDGVPAAPCVRDAKTACLLAGRFAVRGVMRDFEAPPNEVDLRLMEFPGGRAESDQAVFFESFKRGNFELGVKMVDGCGLPADHPLRAYWAFYGGLTNARSEVVVTRMVTRREDAWRNPAGRLPTSEGRTQAFPCEE